MLVVRIGVLDIDPPPSVTVVFEPPLVPVNVQGPPAGQHCQGATKSYSS